MRFPMLAMATLALAACAAPQPPLTHIDWQAEQARIPPGHAMLYVVRPQKPAGRENLYRISLDGTRLLAAGMPVGSYFSCVVGAGAMRIEAQTVPGVRNILSGLPFLEQPHLNISARAGAITFVRVGSTIEGGPTLGEVDAAEGRALAEHARKVPACAP